MKKRTRARKLSFETLNDRRMLAGNVFQHEPDRFDVNMDGQHNAGDLRVVFADLMVNGARELRADDAGAASQEAFFFLQAATGNQSQAGGEDEKQNQPGTGTSVERTVNSPDVEFSSVSTTVSVPDGGTIFLWESRQLQRPLQDLPLGAVWGGTLFRYHTVSTYNGVGQSTDSVTLTVTPRILILDEF